jgi:hypothetical protein
MPAVPDQAAALSQEFPGWALWVSGTGRWWASRQAALNAAGLAAGCVPFLHADGPTALAGQIRAQEAIHARQPTTG